jgi:hypothetical protein
MGRSPWSTAATTRTVALASASRTANTFSSTIDCRGYKGIAACLSWTTTDATQTLNLGVLCGTQFLTDGVFGVSGSVAVSAVGKRMLIVYPGIANGVFPVQQLSTFPNVLLNECQIVVYHGNTNPVTYSVDYKLIP